MQLERARKTGIKELAVFVSASETHNRRNVNDSVQGTLARFREVIRPAVDAGITVPNLPVADESTVVPVPPSPPKADRPAQNFPGVEVHKSDFGS